MIKIFIPMTKKSEFFMTYFMTLVPPTIFPRVSAMPTTKFTILFQTSGFSKTDVGQFLFFAIFLPESRKEFLGPPNSRRTLPETKKYKPIFLAIKSAGTLPMLFLYEPHLLVLYSIVNRFFCQKNFRFLQNLFFSFLEYLSLHFSI